MYLILNYSHECKRHKANQFSHKKATKLAMKKKQWNAILVLAIPTFPLHQRRPYAIAPPSNASTGSLRKPKARRRFAAALTSSPYKAHLHTIKKAKAKDVGVKCEKLILKKAKLQSKLKRPQTTT